MSILVHPLLILLAVMFILGVVDLNDQLFFRYILPERFMVNKLDLYLKQFKVKGIRIDDCFWWLY